MRKYYIGMSILTALVIVFIIIGFMEGGSPFAQKAYTLDTQRLTDMNSLKYAIENHYSKNKKLPASLEDLAPKAPGIDPESKKPYEYKTSGLTSYQLCTTFSTDTSANKNQNTYYDDMYLGVNTPHKKGYDCITYNLPDYLTLVTPIPDKVTEWRDFKSTFLAEFVSFARSDSGTRLIVKENMLTKILYVDDAEILDKEGEKAEYSGFIENDRLLIDVDATKGSNNYRATRVQNLTR